MIVLATSVQQCTTNETKPNKRKAIQTEKLEQKLKKYMGRLTLPTSCKVMVQIGWS